MPSSQPSGPFGTFRLSHSGPALERFDLSGLGLPAIMSKKLSTSSAVLGRLASADRVLGFGLVRLGDAGYYYAVSLSVRGSTSWDRYNP